ncbi:MAG TPA: hypothetical protein VGN79_14305 [Devosia sp.]|jgi:hypothetical protein|nr:hypothetical protein [Devosia sp.]
MPAQSPSIFTEPFQIFLGEKMRTAEMEVDRLSEDDLQSPALGQSLQNIANFKFQVAEIRPDEKTGKRRTEVRSFVDYGRHIQSKVDVLDISIPYSGFPKSFSIAPTNGHTIESKATYQSSSGHLLVVTLDEDDALEVKLATFISEVEDNLQKLGQDMENLRKRLLVHVQDRAQERLNAIKARQEKNKGYSFPVE